MATIYDLIEVTGISGSTTYSLANGNVLGVVDGATSTALDDGEFDIGDSLTIGGTTYTISAIDEPSSAGSFQLDGGGSLGFGPASESNLDVVFLTVTSGPTTRYFIVPNDSYGDMQIDAIVTGNLNAVAGSDAAIISTADNTVNVVCFAAGTEIEVARGCHRSVQHLKPGDEVRTVDHGLQRLLWVGQRRVVKSSERWSLAVAPVRIAAGALGPGTPRHDLIVSPQHRLFVRSNVARRMFGSDEVLVPAKALLGMKGVDIAEDLTEVTYVHLLFRTHEIVFANGALAESLYVGSEARKGVGVAEVAEIQKSLPRAFSTGDPMEPARPFVRYRKACRLAERLVRNQKRLAEFAA